MSIVLVILLLLLASALVPVASAAGTGQAGDTAAALQRFLLYYSGVFALIALTAAVGAGLLATDRIVMSPGRRIVTQALHRGLSIVALAALANHITLEIIAHRATATDAVVPFLAHRRTFYMGLGTVASDLFVVIIVTAILRQRFAVGRRPWLWRGVHAAAYLLWPMAIMHGLLAGRAAKPYVDWSYGGCLAAVGLALTIRSVATMRGRPAAVRPAPETARPLHDVRAMAGSPFGELSPPTAVPRRSPAGRMPAERRVPRAITGPASQSLWAHSQPGQAADDDTGPVAGYLRGVPFSAGEEQR